MRKALTSDNIWGDLNKKGFMFICCGISTYYIRRLPASKLS